MAYTVPIGSIIDYPPEALESFQLYCYEWIDNLHFAMPPERLLEDPTLHVEAARRLFLGEGWDGDGEIGLIWLPAFVFPLERRSVLKPDRVTEVGVVVWHVKQIENGTSWLLSPIELPFEGFCRYL